MTVELTWPPAIEDTHGWRLGMSRLHRIDTAASGYPSEAVWPLLEWSTRRTSGPVGADLIDGLAVRLIASEVRANCSEQSVRFLDLDWDPGAVVAVGAWDGLGNEIALSDLGEGLQTCVLNLQAPRRLDPRNDHKHGPMRLDLREFASHIMGQHWAQHSDTNPGPNDADLAGLTHSIVSALLLGPPAGAPTEHQWEITTTLGISQVQVDEGATPLRALRSLLRRHILAEITARKPEDWSRTVFETGGPIACDFPRKDAAR
ncbi:hypothetical protein [Nocardia niwae]|uniref:hypothetical protein n=1 Tax=Nocardia niwae TaxID=626084 RepID=UPI0033E49849